MNGWLATKMDILMGHLLSSVLYRPSQLHTTDLDTLGLYQGEGYTADPERFFSCPPQPPKVTFGEIRARPAYIYEPFTFPSLYRPLSDAFAQRYADYTENHTVHGRRYRPYLWHSSSRSRATLILLHGWTQGNYIWEELTFVPWLCHACGFTVVALVHPYHGARAPVGSRFSGEYFVSSDMVRNIEACRQAVIDVRSALNWLLGESDGPVGVSGFSLGAFMIYLLLRADGRPAFALPMMGHGDIADGPAGSSLIKHVRHGFRAQGLSYEALRPFARPLTAREMRPQLPVERILPINGRYDTIVTPDKAQQLFEAWEIPQVVWLESGHFGVAYTRSFRLAFRTFVERWIQPEHHA